MVRMRVRNSHSISESSRSDEVTFRLCYLLVIKSQASHLTFMSFIFLTCEVDLINSKLTIFFLLKIHDLHLLYGFYVPGII